MGKASRWFKGLLGLNKPDPNPSPSPNQPQKNTHKKKWSFIKSHKEKDRYDPQDCFGKGIEYGDEVTRHDMGMAAATSSVAEAAVAAAQAATKAMQHTSRGKNIFTTAYVSQICARYQERREEFAAITIQSHFRAYLSRRALRALKALVKLQALVRGHLMRKRTGDALKQLQALVRAQTRARVTRLLSPHSTIKSSHFSHSGPETPEKSEHVIQPRHMNHEQSMILKRNGSKSNGNVNHEVDTWKLHVTPRRRNLFPSYHLSLNSDQNCQSFSTSKDSTARKTGLSLSPAKAQSLSPLKFTEDDESVFYSASSMACSSKREAFTPTKSGGSRSCLSGYSDYNPSYMAYTESSKAKVRSLSAPKQRHQYERSRSTNRYFVHGYGDSRSPHRVSSLQNNFTNKACPGSGRLDKLGMPTKGDVTGFSGSHWLRY